MSGRIKDFVVKEKASKRGHNHGLTMDDEYSEMNVSKCSRVQPIMEKSVSFQKSAR